MSMKHIPGAPFSYPQASILLKREETPQYANGARVSSYNVKRF